MRKAIVLLGALALLVCAAPSVFPAPADDADSIVIVFKDGHRQAFNMADIARIEFNTSGRTTARLDRGAFQGKWKVGDGAGGTFYITLNHDGTATKTLGSAHGTWTVVNGEARISWNDGWRDVIRHRGNGYQKRAYAPGRSLSEEPSNVAEAEPTEPI